jgi:hypothetical protein
MQRTTSGAAGNALGATMKYLRRTTSAAANNGMRTTIIPPCSAASFEVNSERTSLGPFVRGARACSLCSFSHPGYTRAHDLHFVFPVPNCHTDFLTFIRSFPPPFSPFSRVLPAFRLLLRARLFTCRRAGAVLEIVHILAGWCGNHMGTAI